MEIEGLPEPDVDSDGPGTWQPLDVHHATAYPHGQVHVLAGLAGEFLEIAEGDTAHLQAVNRADGQPYGAGTDRVAQILAHHDHVVPTMRCSRLCVLLVGRSRRLLTSVTVIPSG